MIISYHLVTCTIAGAQRRYALYGWFPKCYGDFLGPRSISGKIMKILSVVVKILGELFYPRAGVGNLLSTEGRIVPFLHSRGLYNHKHIEEILPYDCILIYFAIFLFLLVWKFTLNWHHFNNWSSRQPFLQFDFYSFNKLKTEGRTTTCQGPHAARGPQVAHACPRASVEVCAQCMISKWQCKLPYPKIDLW